MSFALSSGILRTLEEILELAPCLSSQEAAEKVLEEVAFVN
jgi:NTP pyrophosphatase (non-canonical NTP hydrolase)